MQTLNSNYKNLDLVYYVGDKYNTAMGLADFLIYDLLLLLVLSPLFSMTIKILVTLGCIVCVQVGNVGTAIIFGRLWKNYAVPALPLPVITFSIYTLILGIVTISSAQCVEY